MAKLKTGRHTSALKEHRKAIRRTVRNVATKSKIKTLVKNILAAAGEKKLDDAKKMLNTAFSELDKAGRRNVIHYKTAANQKARLSRIVLSAANK